MNKQAMDYTQFIGPDALRTWMDLNNNVTKAHTPRYIGYKDINGAKYEGTIENFGSELLLEARKMRLNKIPLDNIFRQNDYDFYFDIKYANFVDTYNQQNLLCAVIKKDVLLSNRTYMIQFNNCSPQIIPRAMSSSDTNVVKDYYLKTKTPPNLIIIKEDGVTETLPLVLDDNTDVDTTYYFHLSYDTEDLCNEPLEDMLEKDSFITVSLTDVMAGYAVVWMTVNALNYLPDAHFTDGDEPPSKYVPYVTPDEPNTYYVEDNIYCVLGDENGADVPPEFNDNENELGSIITIGMDGHDIPKIYPLMNTRLTTFSNYIVKVIPFDEDPFILSPSPSAYERNLTVRIKAIQILKFDNPTVIDPGKEPESIKEITYDTTYTKVTLSHFESEPSQAPFVGKWYFRKPVQGDYDYDGATYKNPVYAYTNLESFISNIKDDSVYDINTKLTPAFTVKFKDSYLYPYEPLLGNCVSGIRVNSSHVYSNNGIETKDGMIHDIADMGGFPTYFKSLEDNDIPHSSIESFVIRDHINKRSQTINDKSVAGIIIDSAIPQTKAYDISIDTPVVLFFDIYDQNHRVFRYVEDDPNISKTNNVSEITFNDKYNFGNSTIPSDKNNPKFIYHGNRFFSTDSMGFDPEKEIGRVYIASSDEPVYENNTLSKNPKSPLTFARICDIPTEFNQLVNIKGLSPTFVLDRFYVRQVASYTTSARNTLYNLTQKTRLYKKENVIVYEYNETPTGFPMYVHLNDPIDLTNENVGYSVGTGGTGYTVGSIFQFYIGGIMIKGIITGINTVDGSVTSFKFYKDEITSEKPILDNPNMNRGNLSRIGLFNTTIIDGFGNGFEIRMEISNEYWNETSISTDGTLSNWMYLHKDVYGHLWGNLNGEDSQLTGYIEYKNMYENDKLMDTVDQAIIDNGIYYTNNIYNDAKVRRTEYAAKYDEESLDKELKTTQDSLIVRDGDNLVIFEICPSLQTEMILPYNNDLGVLNYTNKANKFQVDFDHDQPILSFFDPATNVVYDNESLYSLNTKLVSKKRDKKLSDVIDKKYLDRTGAPQTNVYMFNEFDISHVNDFINVLSVMDKDFLIDYIEDRYNNASILRHGEDVSKERLINFIIENNLIWNSGNVPYTSNMNGTVYRKPSIELCAPAYSETKDQKPITGNNIPIIDFINTEYYIRNVEVYGSPAVILRIDDEIELDNFRVKSSNGKDISANTIIIMNNKRYVAVDINRDIKWINITKEETYDT